ncbi:hypothetical protein IIK_00772 [Bacillus cereus VD102]|nr:hypothetical protein IIK_00772 [Bacillus cereus VD102]
MIKKYFSKGKWDIYDVSQAYKAFNVFEIRGYSEILEEESEIVTLWANDVHYEEQVANLALISKSVEMFEMLEICLKQFKEEGNEIMVKRIEKLLTAATEEEFDVIIEKSDED